MSLGRQERWPDRLVDSELTILVGLPAPGASSSRRLVVPNLIDLPYAIDKRRGETT